MSLFSDHLEQERCIQDRPIESDDMKTKRAECLGENKLKDRNIFFCFSFDGINNILYV